MQNFFTKIALIIVLVTLIVSCNTVKHVSEGDFLLEKNTIKVNEKTNSSPSIQSYLQQRPNQKILGIPFSLLIYNLGNPDTLQIKYWPDSRPGMKKFLTKTFSEKQVIGLKRTSKGLNKWLLKSGNAPVILDSLKTKKSVKSLQNYYFNRGFWDTEVSFGEEKKKKRAKITYDVTTGKPYFLDSLKTKIETSVLDSLYKKTKNKSFIKIGQQFDTKNFEKEENRLVSLFRNSGVYHFGNNMMTFTIDTTNLKTHKHGVLLEIPNRIVEKNDSIYKEPYKIQRVNRVNVYTDFTFTNKDRLPTDSATYNNIHFYSVEKLRYNPKHLAKAIIITPNGVYKDSERDLTRKYLRELQNFVPAIDIKYVENKDETLTANIYLTPLKRFSLGFDTDFTTSNIKPFGILGKASFLNRNIFKGAEIIELSFQGSFLNSALEGSSRNDNFFNAVEIGSSLNLSIPRIFFPFKTDKIIPKRMAPKTKVGVSFGLQENIGLDRQNITGNMEYSWQPTTKTNHSVEILNIQYINNRNTENYFNIYQSEQQKLNNIAFSSEFNNITPSDDYVLTADNNKKSLKYNSLNAYIADILNPVNNYANTNPVEYGIAQNVREQESILVEDVLVPVMSYTFNYNNRENFQDNNFSTFTGRLISAGNLTTAFINKKPDESFKKLFGLRVAQYIKTEVEYKKYWAFNSNSTLVFRNFIGAAFPYGNSDDIPFSRSYRAGGSNDIRAWRTFKLGRGAEPSVLEFNVGSFKLTTNLEYRFKVVNSLNGALFVDAGNIWDISNSNLASEKAKFTGFNSLSDIAVGSGFGARYDFGFLIFRLDTGFKTYEPYRISKKWFTNYNFKNATYNVGINYPF